MAVADITHAAPSWQVLGTIAGLALALAQPAHAGSIDPLFRSQSGWGFECEGVFPPYVRTSVAIHPSEMRVLFRVRGVVSSAPVTTVILSAPLPNAFGRYDLTDTTRNLIWLGWNSGWVNPGGAWIQGVSYKCISTGEDIEEAPPASTALERCDPPKIRTLVGCEAAPPTPPVTGESAESRYTRTVLEMIRDHLHATPDLHLDLASKHGVVDVHIDKSGNLVDRKLAASSGSPNLDAAVMAAIAEAGPYPAPPRGASVSLNYNFGQTGAASQPAHADDDQRRLAQALVTGFCVQGMIESERATGVTVLTSDEKEYERECAELAGKLDYSKLKQNPVPHAPSEDEKRLNDLIDRNQNASLPTPPPDRRELAEQMRAWCDDLRSQKHPNAKQLADCELIVETRRPSPPTPPSSPPVRQTVSAEQMRAWCGVLRSRNNASAKDLAQCAR
jgi:TonB family protein